jgi:hypothetical protein
MGGGGKPFVEQVSSHPTGPAEAEVSDTLKPVVATDALSLRSSGVLRQLQRAILRPVRVDRFAVICKSLHKVLWIRVVTGDVAQLVRALPCHGRGRGFEPRRPRHKPNKKRVYGLRKVTINSYGIPRYATSPTAPISFQHELSKPCTRVPLLSGGGLYVYGPLTVFGGSFD